MSRTGHSSLLRKGSSGHFLPARRHRQTSSQRNHCELGRRKELIQRGRCLLPFSWTVMVASSQNPSRSFIQVSFRLPLEMFDRPSSVRTQMQCRSSGARTSCPAKIYDRSLHRLPAPQAVKDIDFGRERALRKAHRNAIRPPDIEYMCSIV